MSKFSQEKIEDYLEVDDPIPGQQFVCLSFVTPEKVLKKKEVFKASKFLEYVFTNEDRPTQDMRAKLSSGDKSEFSYEKINEFYEDWRFNREQQLEEEFHKIQNFQTTIQGIKVRGVYSTEPEARIRAKKLHQKDPNFHVYIAPVGYWLPYEPDPNGVADQEYQVEELNKLTKEYFTNQQGKDELYQQLKREQLEKARKELDERKKKLREENVKVAETSEEDIRNIQELRQMVDESDQQFLDKVQDEYNSKKDTGLSGLESDDPWISRKKENEKASSSETTK
jgi:hypothetical protein